MDYIISHISALEYWRNVGQSGVAMPTRPSRAAIPSLPPRANQLDESVGRLSLPLHISCAAKHKNRPGAAIVSHQVSTALPAGSIRKLSSNCGITSPELTLMHVASMLSVPELAGLICEFCGKFSVDDNLPHGMFPRPALTSVRKLQAFARATSGLSGVHALRTASAYALDNSRSPAETAAGLLLTLPRMRGGYGLKGARLNRTIPLTAKTRNIASVTHLEPDILWPNAHICVEYDSKEFHREEGRIANDARRKNALLSSNLHVVTLTSAQLSNRQEMDKVAKHIAAKMGKRWNPPDFQKQVKLRNELLGAASTIRRSQAILIRAEQAPQRAMRENERIVCRAPRTIESGNV